MQQRVYLFLEPNDLLYDLNVVLMGMTKALNQVGDATNVDVIFFFIFVLR